jgi:hypothetical protein
MKKSEIFKSKFPDFCGTLGFYTEDCQMVNFIDVESDIVEFATLVPMSCYKTKAHSITLSELLDEMPDNDFEKFLEIF